MVLYCGHIRLFVLLDAGNRMGKITERDVQTTKHRCFLWREVL